MAAILSTTSAGPHPHHRHERVPGRSQLQVIEGGRSPRRLAIAYRRRRLAALATVLVLIVGALAAGRVALAAVTPSPPSPGASTRAGEAPAGAVVVVRPGDTLWSIARRASPQGDVRAMVDRLAAAHGSGPLEVGEVLPIGAAVGG